MAITEVKPKSNKAKKSSELKKSKTEAMLFFLRCLNESVDIHQLEEFSSLQYLSFDEQQNLIQAFKNLPHPDLMFYQTINTYRASKILKILGENINPLQLKKFNRSDLNEKNSKENKIECQLVLKMIESNQAEYREVLKLFMDSFKKNVEIKWQKNEPDLLEQHLEKQKRLFAQRNSKSQKANDSESLSTKNTASVKITPSIASVSNNQVLKQTATSLPTLSAKNVSQSDQSSSNLLNNSNEIQV